MLISELFKNQKVNETVTTTFKFTNDVTVVKAKDLKEKDLANPVDAKKFFFYNNKSLNELYYEVNKEDYERTVSLFKKQPKAKNLKFETASKYFKNKVTQMVIRKAFNLSYKTDVVLKGMINEDVASYGGTLQYAMYKEDEFRDSSNEVDLRNATAREVYIDLDVRDTVPNVKVIDELLRVCMVALRKKLIIVLDMEDTINLVYSVLDYSYGLSQNITKAQDGMLNKAYRSLKEKLLDADIQKFIKQYNDKDIYSEEDFYSTYRRIYNKIFNIKTLAQAFSADSELELDTLTASEKCKMFDTSFEDPDIYLYPELYNEDEDKDEE